MFLIIISLVIGYFLGSIPFGYIITKLHMKKDIRNVGSSNIGGANVQRTLGTFWGLITVLFDILKAVIPIVILKYFILPDNLTNGIIICCVALSIIVGHIFPIFLKFKGGKGVAVFIGIILSLFPFEGIIFLGLYVILLALTRYTSLSSIITVASFPVILYLSKGWSINVLPYLIMFIILAVLIIIKHKDNIKRLKSGTERRFRLMKNKY